MPAKARGRINRSIADSAFHEINRQLAYKSEWAGRVFVLVPASTPTAQTCSKCGYKNVALAGDPRDTWTCPECFAVHDRKHNGAKNVLEAGLDILKEQESSYISKAWERREGKSEKP